MKKILFLFLLSVSVGFAQNGLKFAELAKRLDPYFDKALITDIQKQLPQGSDYTIWGWDVGDYSGDGYNDVAMSVRVAADRSKELQVFLFVDIDGFLTKVGHYYYEFVEIPLEIGVVIKENTCYVTKKLKQHNWKMIGYSFENGALFKIDEFTTERIGDLTKETYFNYRNLRNTYKFLKTKSGEETFFRDYLSIPSYPRGILIYEGYQSETFVNFIDFVPEGAYYWDGERDASYYVNSAHDNDYLYFTLTVFDESIIKQNCDTCVTDYFEVWIDTNTPLEGNDRFTRINENQLEFKTNPESGIFCFKVYPGNFLDIKPYVKVSTTDELVPLQKMEAKNIRAASNIFDDGFIVKFKIPFMVLGFPTNPVQEGEVFELGCSVIYKDIDNQYRSDEITQLATSDFNSNDPTTYGSLLIVPYNSWYGESNNIYTDDILRNLLEYGF